MKKAFQFAAVLTLAGLMTMSESEAGRKSRGSSGSYGSVGSTGSVGGSYGSVGSAASSGSSYGSSGSAGRRVKKSKGSSGGASSGGYASSGSASSGGASSGGSSGRVKTARVKKVRVRRSRGSSGSLGSTGSGGGSYGSHSSHGSGSYGGSHGTTTYSQPVYHAAPSGCANGNCAVSTSSTIRTTPVASQKYAGYALLVVNVPETASVYLDGKRMQTTGATRKFKIPVRTANQAYAYPVRVELENNGTTQVASFSKAISAGKTSTVTASAASLNGATRVASL